MRPPLLVIQVVIRCAKSAGNFSKPMTVIPNKTLKRLSSNSYTDIVDNLPWITIRRRLCKRATYAR